MSVLEWDLTGERRYETGVDHGVLYIPDSGGVYDNGYAWNGLTTVTESPSGADVTPTYADNIKYLSLQAVEEFGATIEAYTYPDEFGQCDGTAEPEVGVTMGQQNRHSFGLSYRTRVGNDVEGTDLGYKLHLIYGALAMPSEKAYATINDTPEAITFSWEVTTTPVPVSGTNPLTGKPFKPTAQLTIDSTKANATALAELEALLYGTVGTDPSLPLPNAVIALFAGSATAVNLVAANAPSYNTGTHVVTLPTVVGVSWKINGVDATPGAQPAMTAGQTSAITSHLADGYYYAPTSDDDWVFAY